MSLQVVHSDAAGIDVGGSEHWDAITPDRDPEPVIVSDALPLICVRWDDGRLIKTVAKRNGLQALVLRLFSPD
jgi:hypothetical protein